MRVVVGVVLGCCFAAGAYAQTDPTPVWEGQVGASYVANSGNTNNSTVGASGELVWQPGRFRTVANSEFIRTTNDNRLGSKRFAVSLRTEHTIPLRMSVYGKTAYFEDTPAGTQRQFSVTAGGLAHILKGDRRSLALMLALTKTTERRVVAPDRNFIGSDVGIECQAKLNSVMTFEHASGFVRDFSDGSNWRLRLTTSVGAALNKRLAFKFSHQLYRNKPDAGRRATDQTMLASLVVRWPSH